MFFMYYHIYYEDFGYDAALRIAKFKDVYVQVREGKSGAAIIGRFGEDPNYCTTLCVFDSKEAAHGVMRQILAAIAEGQNTFDLTDPKFDGIRYHKPKTIKEEGD